MLWLENLLSQATLERLGWTLVHFIWQAAVVAMLLAVFLRLLRKSSANLRYLAACSALLLMVVLPVATMQFIEVPRPAAEAGPLPTASSAIAPPTAIGVVEEMAPLSQTPDSPQNVNPATAIPWNERIASVLEPALPYVVLGWLAGVFGLSAWHLGGWMQLQRLKRRMVHGVGTALQHRLVQIAHRLGVHRAVTLLESALVEVPTVVGWLRPVILLPASALTGLSPEQLEAILAHELAHIRRCDYLVNVLQTVVEILGFYHPAVWWVSRRIRIERENCCDDMAVRVCGDRVRYARALTCMEEIRHSQAELVLAATGGNLLDRIARLLGRPTADDRRFAWLPGVIALLLVLGVVVPTALTLANAGSDRLAPPSAEPAVVASDGRDEAREDMASTQVLISYSLFEAAGEPNDSTVGAARVLIKVKIIEAADSRPLDRETVVQIESILGRPVRPEGRAGRSSRLRLTLGEVLRKHVLPQSLPDAAMQAFVDLLEAKGYLTVLSSPRVLAVDGRKAQIRVGRDEYFWIDPAADGSSGTRELQKVETGTRLDVTPHVNDANNVFMDIEVELSDIPSVPKDGAAPAISRRTARTAVVMPSGRCITLGGMVEDASAQAKDGRSLYIMATPSIVKAPTGDNETGTPTGETGQREESAAELRSPVLPDGTTVEQRITARAEYVNSDPVYQELAKQVVQTERELIEDGQKFAPGHPQMIQKQALLYSLKSRTDERKKRLEQKFEDQYTMRGTAPANGKPQVRVEFRVIDVSSKRSLDRKTAVEAADILAWTPLKPKISELQRPLGQILQQYTADGALSGRPLEGFVNLLVSRGYAKQLASPAILVPDGQQARIEIGDNVESLDRVDAGQLAFGVTPKSHPEKDAVLLNLHFEVRRQAESEPQTAEPRTTIEATEAELFAKNAEYVAVPRTAPITWHDKQSNERTLLLMVKPTIVKAAPSPGTAQVPEAPQPIETRRIRLNYIEAGHVISLLSSALQPYVKPEPAGRSGLDSHYLTVTAPRAIVDQIMAEIRQMDIRPRQVLLDARIIAIDPNDLPSLGIDWSLPAPRAEEASGLAPEDANAVNDTSVRRVQIGTALDHASTVSLSAALDAIREDDRLHVLSSPQMVGQDGRVSRLSCILTDGALVPVTSLPVTESGIVISLTPLVGDNNNITLEITTDTEERFSPGPSSDTSVVTRRTTRNAVTIRDGGTVVLTGWTPNVRAQKRELTAGLADSPPAGASRRNDGKDTPPRETVFFLTASLLPEAK